MQSILTQLENIMATYWGQSEYQLFLYIAIIVILLLEKESWKKITFGWYGIVCFAGLFNPITVKITSKIWGESAAYYCRQISLIPIFIIIAYAIALIVKQFNRRFRCWCVIIFAIVIVGNGNQIYGESWYTKSSNFYKIPGDVIEIAEYLSNESEKITIASATSLSAYFRQYSNLIQAQGRYVKYYDIENLENVENIKPNLIVQSLGEKGCDYFIVKNYDEIREAFRDAGIEKCYESDAYIVYKVEKTERWKCFYDDKNMLIKKTHLNQYDKKVDCGSGFTSVEYTRYLSGEIKTEHYFNERNQPVALCDGQYGVLYSYDKMGRIIQKTYLNEKNQETPICYGYSRVCFSYGTNYSDYTESYYDTGGNPISLREGQWATQYIYDEKNRIIQMVFLDKDNNIKKTEYGYAIIRFEYNQLGQKISEHYFDENDEPIALEGGQYGLKYVYDENNNIKEQLKLDKNDNIIR